MNTKKLAGRCAEVIPLDSETERELVRDGRADSLEPRPAILR